MTASRHWRIGICGTFDVENYGDLLFPLLASDALSRRLGEVTVLPFLYHRRTTDDWCYDVTSVADLPSMVEHLDGLLIGGGFIVRFDKSVAPGYLPPSPAVHHPTGYRLTPTLMALQHDVPVYWNAPGMHCNEIPAWAKGLLKHVTDNSRYVSVRDQASAEILGEAIGQRIDVVPDTGFGLGNLVDANGPPSEEYLRFREHVGIHDRYVVLQSTLGLLPFAEALRQHAGAFGDLQFLALPIGPVLGEAAWILPADLPGLVPVTEWPKPLLVAEIIARAEAVVGHSYHLIITALTAGVPVFTHQDLAIGKYASLLGAETIHRVSGSAVDMDPAWFRSRLGRRAISAFADEQRAAVSRHWDHIAADINGNASRSHQSVTRYWQSLPGALEDASTAHQDAAEAARAAYEAAAMELTSVRHALEASQTRVKDLTTRVEESETGAGRLRVALDGITSELAERTRHLETLQRSRSWRLTRPFRAVVRRLRHLRGLTE